MGNEHTAINCLHRTGLRLVERGGDLWNVWLDYRPVNCRHSQDGKRTPLEPLLFLHVLVAGKENVKALLLDQRQQVAVLGSTPLHADDRMNFIIGQREY